MTELWDVDPARHEGELDYLEKGNQRMDIYAAADYLDELEAKVERLESELSAAEKDLVRQIETANEYMRDAENLRERFRQLPDFEKWKGLIQ